MLTERLSERLKAITDTANQLPPEAQDKLAEQIASALDDALWDAQLHDPKHLAILREMAEEARQAPKLPMPTPADLGDEVMLGEEDAGDVSRNGSVVRN